MTPDVNVLLAASRDDHPHHRVAHDWLRESVDSAAEGATLTLIPMVIASFLRLATNTRVFTYPMPIANAVGFIDSLLDARGVEVATLGGEWPVFRELCLDKKLRGNDLPDAWLAAAVTELGEHLTTLDADFKKLLRRNQFTLLKAA